jgi:hypothetical protein
MYSQTSTIKELVNNLMIEQWNTSTIYEQYYNECQPAHCTYTLQMRNDVIYIVTTLFGIAGGITTTLKFILPLLFKLLRRKKQQRSAAGKRKPKTGKCVRLRRVVTVQDSEIIDEIFHCV